MNNDFKPVPLKENIVVQELNGEVLIYDLGKNKAYCLNETSALVWQMCNGNKSIGEISQEISKKLKSPVTEDFVWLAIDQLKKDNLLANNEEIIPNFNGLSRREVIKKVGLGTMIALPVVASLVAPTAAMAQSVQAVACSTLACSCDNVNNDPHQVGQPCVSTGFNQCPRSTEAGCVCRNADANATGAGICHV